MVSSCFTTQELSWPHGRSPAGVEMAMDGMPAETSVDATCSRRFAAQESWVPVTRPVMGRGSKG